MIFEKLSCSQKRMWFWGVKKDLPVFLQNGFVPVKLEPYLRSTYSLEEGTVGQQHCLKKIWQLIRFLLKIVTSLPWNTPLLMLNFLHSLMMYFLTTRKFTSWCVTLWDCFALWRKWLVLPLCWKSPASAMLCWQGCVQSSQTILPLEMDQPLSEGRKNAIGTIWCTKIWQVNGSFSRCWSLQLFLIASFTVLRLS